MRRPAGTRRPPPSVAPRGPRSESGECFSVLLVALGILARADKGRFLQTAAGGPASPNAN
eukprot:8720405-Pyramimonas_sp.AAC.1